MGKARLAPIKEISIPRLELSAVVLSVKLCQMVREELEYNINTILYWTDSMSVLKCINNENKRFHTFESNRLTVIHSAANPSQFRYVDRNINPADDGSKGLKLKSFIQNNRWLTGPEFLSKEEYLWPKIANVPALLDTDPEVRKEAAVYVVKNEADDLIQKLFNHYSSFWKLKRAVAFILRLKTLLQNRVLGRVTDFDLTDCLTVKELKIAEIEILRHVQKHSFPETVKGFLSDLKKPLKECGSNLLKLNPSWRNDLICVGGRLENVQLSGFVKHPIILPYKNHVTTLIIREVHDSVGHMGQETVLSTLRQKYWVVKGRSAVKQVISKCVICQRRSKYTATQFMADLPKHRLEINKPPFSAVGIDYFGPLLVKQGRSSVKRYGCLFTCMTSRAVHVEIAHSLNTDSMINALRRFVSARGYPETIWSDNGSNFTSADKELTESVNKFNQEQISNFCLQRNISWHFNPPAASHMGGVWERMIRSVRQILKSVLKEQLVCDEVLLTVVSEAVYILNNRPLTRNSDSVMDLEPLTPNHLLHLRSSSGLPPGLFDQKDLYLRRKWRQAQYLSNIFWTRWVKEYLPTLTERSKWCEIKRNISVGDLVLITDERFSRGQWPLAVVVEAVKSKDGLVRTVKVRTRSTVATCAKRRGHADIKDGFVILTRPIHKICVLELDQSIADSTAHN